MSHLSYNRLQLFFGTSDKETCLENTDAHMYRIIAITEDGKIKLIKNEALTKLWHSSAINITWPNSDLHKEINGSSFLTNSSYMPEGWSDKLETFSWKYGDNIYQKTSAEEIYNVENGWTDTVNAKIGLMYIHDYSYSYTSGGLNCLKSGVYYTCVKSWMHQRVSDPDGTPHEWTMSHYSNYYTWYVSYDGYIAYETLLSNEFSIRPVFFLNSNAEFLSDIGTSTDPFIIS